MRIFLGVIVLYYSNDRSDHCNDYMIVEFLDRAIMSPEFGTFFIYSSEIGRLPVISIEHCVNSRLRNTE